MTGPREPGMLYPTATTMEIAMGRVLKRVPMEFDWPLGKVWGGYLVEEPCTLCDPRDPAMPSDDCNECGGEGSTWPVTEPPTGPGYQLWETTSEGSPMSPVFESLDELCRHAADHCPVFGREQATYEQWREWLDPDPDPEHEGPDIRIDNWIIL